VGRGISLITDAGLTAASGSGVASRSFTATRRSSKPSAGGERVNVLLSLEIQQESKQPVGPKRPLPLGALRQLPHFASRSYATAGVQTSFSRAEGQCLIQSKM